MFHLKCRLSYGLILSKIRGPVAPNNRHGSPLRMLDRARAGNASRLERLDLIAVFAVLVTRICGAGLATIAEPADRAALRHPGERRASAVRSHPPDSERGNLATGADGPRSALGKAPSCLAVTRSRTDPRRLRGRDSGGGVPAAGDAPGPSALRRMACRHLALDPVADTFGRSERFADDEAVGRTCPLPPLACFGRMRRGIYGDR